MENTFTSEKIEYKKGDKYDGFLLIWKKGKGVIYYKNNYIYEENVDTEGEATIRKYTNNFWIMWWWINERENIYIQIIIVIKMIG